MYEELVKELQIKVGNLKKKMLSKTLKNLQFHSNRPSNKRVPTGPCNTLQGFTEQVAIWQEKYKTLLLHEQTYEQGLKY